MSENFSRHVMDYLQFYFLVSLCLFVPLHEVRFLSVDFSLFEVSEVPGVMKGVKLAFGFDLAVALIALATVLKADFSHRILSRRVLLSLSAVVLLASAILFFGYGYYAGFSLFALAPSFILYGFWVPLYLKASKSDLPDWSFKGKDGSFKVKVFESFVLLLLLGVLPSYIGGRVFEGHIPEGFMSNLEDFNAHLDLYGTARAGAMLWTSLVAALMSVLFFFAYTSALGDLKKYKVVEE